LTIDSPHMRRAQYTAYNARAGVILEAM